MAGSKKVVGDGSRARSTLAAALFAVFATFTGTWPHPAAAAGTRIVVSGSIQAAVDAASPGDTVVVPPGVYTETVLVNTSDITIEGPAGAIVDAGAHLTPSP